MHTWSLDDVLLMTHAVHVYYRSQAEHIPTMVRGLWNTFSPLQPEVEEGENFSGGAQKLSAQIYKLQNHNLHINIIKVIPPKNPGTCAWSSSVIWMFSFHAFPKHTCHCLSQRALPLGVMAMRTLLVKYLAWHICQLIVKRLGRKVSSMSKAQAVMESGNRQTHKRMLAHPATPQMLTGACCRVKKCFVTSAF